MCLRAWTGKGSSEEVTFLEIPVCFSKPTSSKDRKNAVFIKIQITL